MKRIKGRIRFYVRILPDERKGVDCFDVDSDRKTLWHCTDKCIDTQKAKSAFKFETDGLFTDECQSEIYDTIIGHELSTIITKGIDAVLIAFGQHGTGKTYSMNGLRDHYYYRGIIPRVAEDLFNIQIKFNFIIRVSALEFSRHKTLDLLDPSIPEVDCRVKEFKNVATRTEFSNVDIQNRNTSIDLGAFLEGTEVENLKEAMDLIFLAESRSSKSNTSNCGSVVVTLFIQPIQKNVFNANIQKIHLMDMDGTHGPWAQLAENMCINKLLESRQNGHEQIFDSSDWPFLAQKSVRRQLNFQLAFRNSAKVGYVWNTLTQGNVRLFGHIRRGEGFQRYTLATLRYGCTLIGKPQQICQRTVITSIKTINESLKSEVQRLRDDLILKELLVNQTVPITAPDFEEESLNDLIVKYLTNSDTQDVARFLKIAHPITILKRFKFNYKRCLDNLKTLYDTNLRKFSEVTIAMPSIDRASKKSLKRSLHNVEASKVSIVITNPTDTSAKASEEDSKRAAEQEKAIAAAVKAEKIENAQNNWRLMWKEFLTRYPFWHRALASVGEDMASVKAEKEAEEEKIVQILQEIRNHTLEVEKTVWDRIRDIGDKVGEDGHVIMTRKEKDAMKKKEALEEQYKKALGTFSILQKQHLQVASRFVDMQDQANRLFTDYVHTTYENILVLPDSENYDLTVPMLGVDLSKHSSKTEVEENFLRLQTKHLYQGRKQKPRPNWT